jgi:hypothetical protein
LINSPLAVSQQPPTANDSTNAAARAASARELETWRSTTTAAPPAEAGCYRLDYPAKVWQKIDCGPPPADPPRTLRPQAPARQNIQPNAQPLAGDYTMTPVNKITSATGRMVTLNQVTSVGSTNANTGTVTPGLFSIQLNSSKSLPANTGTVSCKSSFNPKNCIGWIQFVYNNSRQLYIQYWFINYLANTTQSCPSSLPFSSKGNPKSSGLDCGANAAITTLASSAPTDFTKMQGVSLTGQALSTGKVVATLTAGGTSYAVTGTDAVSTATGWSSAEFNIFGSGSSSAGTFNTVQLNTAAQVTMSLTSNNDSSLKQPGCTTGTTTAENSNMFLGPCYTTTTPGIWFNESPNVPVFTASQLSPSQGPAVGGTAVQVQGGPFNQPFQIDFGAQIVQPINTLPSDVTVNSPPGTAGSAVQVSAAYVFPSGGLGPFSASLPFLYYATPGCTFSEFCPFYQNQPPSYTATCSAPTDFYTTSNIQVPGDFNTIALGATTTTGSTTGEAVTLAACQQSSKTQCNFYSIDVSSAQWCHPTTPPKPPPPPPACSKCGGGQKCCPNPDGGVGVSCVPANLSCPVVH